MSPRLLAILLIIAAVSHASPLPGPTGYNSTGSPAFFQGAFKAITDSAFITIISGQGSVTQVLEADQSVSTVVTTYDSYECINPLTFRVEGTITQFPSTFSGRWCGIVFTNGTHLVIKGASVLLGSCPDSITTPAAPGELLGVYTAVPGIVPAPNTQFCSSPGVPNFTNFPPPPPLSTTSPPPTMQSSPSPSPTPSPGSKPTKVNLLPYAGSAQPQYGLWGAPGVFMYHSQKSMCATRYEDGILKLQIAQFSSFQCTGPNAFYQTFNLTQYNAIDLKNPLDMSICLSGSRDTTSPTNNTLTVFMTLFGPCPAAVQNGPTSPGVIEVLTTSLITPIPGNPNTTCENPPTPPSPSPTPSPTPTAPKSCTWKGTWTISPLLSSCSKQRFAFKPTACSNTSVALRTAKQLGTGADRQSSFGLDHSWSSSSGPKAGVVTAIRDSDCKSNELTGPTGGESASTLALKQNGLSWKIVPLKGGDCTSVNLVSESGGNKGKYLQVSRSCKGFSWAKNDGGKARFKLSKASELGI